MTAYRVYVAASWRTPRQPGLVAALRRDGHAVYDFRDEGFSWSEVDREWESWTMQQFIEGLRHPAAERGFVRDLHYLDWCEKCVLVQPSGRSAHLEFGYTIGQGKRGCVLLAPGQEPDLMYKLTPYLFTDSDAVREWVAHG